VADAGLEIVKWVGEAVAATLVGGAATWFGSTRNLRAIVDRLTERVAELEEMVERLSEERVHAREQSSADHANASNLAQRVVEVKALAEATHARMERILGLLQGKGIG
jgi:outer membrane murein-binding lipoprotein Lpp